MGGGSTSYRDIFDPVTGLPLSVTVDHGTVDAQTYGWGLRSVFPGPDLYAHPHSQDEPSTIISQTDDEGAAVWSQQRVARDAEGDLLWIERLGDNGLNTKTWFHEASPDGRTSTSFFVDTADAKPWMFRTDLKFSLPDQVVDPLIRSSFRDDFVLEQFVRDPGGQQSWVLVDFGDQFDWAFRQSTLDIDGLRKVTTTTYDTGETRESTATFDADGVLTRRVSELSDGRFADVSYRADGSRETVVISDGLDLFQFKTNTADYDADGQITRRQIEMDDGRLITETFNDAGIRQRRVTEDVDDVYRYDTITRTYDENGDLLSQVVTPDTGDLF